MKEILKDEFITVSETGKNYDFIATIENNGNGFIRFERSGEDLFCVEPNEWVGLLANEEDTRILEALKNKKYYRHICEQSISYELEEN